MKTITITKSDFDINNQKTVKAFNDKLQEIDEPFEVIFDYPTTEISKTLFYNNTKLAKIDIPASITEIDNYAFEYCESLKEITIPDSVTKINSYTFVYCISLTKIKLPNAICHIGNYAFHNCESLTKITIPSSIKYLGYNIFYNCTSLQKITIQMLQKDFFEKVEGAEDFYNKYKEKIEFTDPLSLDSLLLKTNSLETIINTIEER